MKKFIPFLLLVVVAAAGTAWGDFYGTVQMGVGVTGNNPTATFNWEGGAVYVGPYQYYISGPVLDSAGLTNPVNSETVTTGGYLSSVLMPAMTNPSPVNGYCVDFTTNINGAVGGPSTIYSTDVFNLGDPGTLHVSSGSVATIANDINRLVVEFAIAKGNPTAPAIGSPLATALQYALWEATNATPGNYNVGNNLSSDSLGETPGNSNPSLNALTVPSSQPDYSSAAPAQIANYWLDHMGDVSQTNLDLLAANGGVYALVPLNAGTQAQIQSVVIELGGFTPTIPSVPEPMGLVALASLVLCVIPIGGIALHRRRRKA